MIGEKMDDLISRQAAIDACHNYEDGKDAYAYGDVVEKRLKTLPSAQPSAQPTINLVLRDKENGIIYAPVRHICIVRCKECKHRPVKRDINGEDYGFNLLSPNDGDERCPCLVDDGWYSWMPEDDFYCGYGERGGAKMED